MEIDTRPLAIDISLCTNTYGNCRAEGSCIECIKEHFTNLVEKEKNNDT